MRALEFITELFEPDKQNWKWRRQSSDEAFASFVVADREYQWHAFSSEANPAKWEIQFRLMRASTDPDGLDLFGKTGTGNSAQVLSTAVDITRSFLQTYELDKVEEITFNAKEDSRINLYVKMIRRLLPDWDLSSRKSRDKGMQFTLTDTRAYDKPENKIKGVAEGLEHYDGIEISMEKEDDEIMVKAMMSGGRELGHVLFVIDGEYLAPQDLEVDERYQGQGIAATMYDYVKSKGYKIRRSGQQTDAGAGFWDKHRPEQNVWENFADGKNPGRKGLAKRVGVDCKQPISKLRSIASNSSGERQRMAHWCANMKSGKKK
jgi:GNAT superfamily N-acetyltransferase